MPNPVKYNTESETRALKQGNFWFGTGDVAKGPTATTGYYVGPQIPEGGYLIYLYKEQSKKLLKTSKLSWYEQDVKKLINNTFNPSIIFDDLERTLTKAQEIELLVKFNKIILEIAQQEKINETLFFSKKAQKDFLRLVLKVGLEPACNELTPWRNKLLARPLLNLFK